MEPAELPERLGMVVHAQVVDALVRRRLLGGHDDEPGRLPATEVPARSFRGVERGEEPLGQRPGGGERLCHRRPDVARAQHVPGR